MSADEGVRRRSVAILIFDDVELLDFAGPFEVFSSARALTGERQRLMDVFTVAEHDRPGLDERSVFGLFLVFARARLRGAEERWDECFADLHRGLDRKSVV